MTAAQPQWEFLQAENGSWAWRRSDMGTVSNSHKSLGAALSDALGHGFSPSRHHWLVVDRLSVVRFSPGEPPQTLAKLSRVDP